MLHISFQDPVAENQKQRPTERQEESSYFNPNEYSLEQAQDRKDHNQVFSEIQN